ncbi:MAG: hypothetical protein ABJA67_01225 [Chthonomonadales bacterium]
MTLGSLLSLSSLVLITPSVCRAQTDAPLPSGVKANWDSVAAYHDRTPTRERISINGLWRWQPGAADASAVPTGGWGYFKVPGCWPGITDYMQKDCQTLFAHPDWKNASVAGVTSAWYQREITIPANWTGRKISVSAEYVNSLAVVYVDGKKAGEIKFPAGNLDVSGMCKPGSKHLLSLQVTAMPLKAIILSYTDTNAARLVKGAVNRRGLCGDVWLTSAPKTTSILNVKVETSVRRSEITFRVDLHNLPLSGTYSIRAEILDHGKPVQTFTSKKFTTAEIVDGRFKFKQKWESPKLWDTNTPQNIYTASMSLLDSSGKPVDVSYGTRFGFREFTIVGRDFYLNGSRIWLSALPLDNAQVGAEWASYTGAKESMERLKSFGINFVYTHNYDCEPGSHLSFAEILRAADDTGMLVALSQPHFSNYDWQAPDADKSNGYGGHAAFYTKVAQDHPSVVAYAMSHNATSYDEAKNPDKIDGLPMERDSWSMNNVKKAQLAEAIVSRLDPSRIVYHHSSGNLGTMYTENFYVNFAPIQELSDWFEHWATVGIKPLFLCEYGNPFSWDWAMYRGWYKGKREWGSANVPWELCIAEWNAQFYGDTAYKISEREKADLRWEANAFKTREGWHRWDYPTAIGSGAFDERSPVFASYITDNWRAYRTWGVSAFSPWEYEAYWNLRPGVDRSMKKLAVDWDHIQKPGYSADYIDQPFDSMTMSYERKDWIPSEAAKAVIRNNGPLLAYIGGKKSKFTSKDHIFHALDTVEKQLIIINNSRVTVDCECSWLFEQAKSNVHATIKTGQQLQIPLDVKLQANVAPGRHKLTATVRFSTGETQEDSFDIDILPSAKADKINSRIGLFDPKGETGKVLTTLGIQVRPVDATTDLAGIDLLIIGKGALTLGGAAPDIRKVRQGLKVIVFEQTPEVLEQRLGFRTAEYGLRQVFPRVGDHPMLAGLTTETLRDWQGESTILPSRLQYTLKPMYGPMVKWCGMDVPHVWRCGNQGNVASALIEKPASGDFLPIIDGGYSLQYSPLLLHRQGSGIVIFCQMDVSGRTEQEPAAALLVKNILRYASSWKATPLISARYVGFYGGEAQLKAAGFDVNRATRQSAKSREVIIVGPGRTTPSAGPSIKSEIGDGTQVMVVGLSEAEINALFPNKVKATPAEHVASYFESGKTGTWLEGISSADVHNRTATKIPLVTTAPEIVSDGVLARASGSSVVVCPLAPWQFDPTKMGEKRTFRRFSYLLSRLLANMGVASTSPILDNFIKPTTNGGERRWLSGLYLDVPDEWDDPYRFFPW